MDAQNTSPPANQGEGEEEDLVLEDLVLEDLVLEDKARRGVGRDLSAELAGLRVELAEARAVADDAICSATMAEAQVRRRSFC